MHLARSGNDSGLGLFRYTLDHHYHGTDMSVSSWDGKKA
jgi:hypothetical protein